MIERVPARMPLVFTGLTTCPAVLTRLFTMTPRIWLKLFCLLSVLVSAPAFGRELTPKDRADLFFQTLMKGETNKAFEVLFEGSPFAQAKSEELERLKEDAKKHLATTHIVGFERVKEQAYGQSVVKLVYVLKLESQPLVWEFHFYRARTTWNLARLGFDEDLRRLD